MLLHHRSDVRCDKPLWLHHQALPLEARLVSVRGTDRRRDCLACQHLRRVHRAPARDLDHRVLVFTGLTAYDTQSIKEQYFRAPYALWECLNEAKASDAFVRSAQPANRLLVWN